MAEGYLHKYGRVLDGEYLHASAPLSQVHPRDLSWLP
jgi:hypothetical protein